MSNENTIKLGLLAPLTGLVGLYGEEICNAAKIAAEEVNDHGGVLGKRLELVIEDDGSLPDTAVPAGVRLVKEHGCSAIIGNLLSNSRISVCDLVAERFRIPQLNFSFYEGSIQSRYFFHFAALPNQQIHKMIPFMAKEFGPKFFFAGSNYEWPLGSIDSAKRVVRDISGEIVGEEYLPIGTDQIDALLSNVARSGADVFVPYFAGQDQVNLLTRFTEMGLKKRMHVVMGHYDEAMVGQLPPEVREGFFSSNTYFMSIDTPQNRSYMAALARMPGVTGLWPDGNGVLTNFGEGTYICVHAFAKAAKAAGSVDADALIAALENISVSAPQGEVMMDPATHHAHVNTFLSRCDAEGNFTIVESFGRIPPMIPARYRADAVAVTEENLTAATAHALPPAPGIASPGIAHRPDSDEKENDVENAVFLYSDLAILISDQQGRIVDVNPSLARMFGYVPEELRGQEVALLVPPRFRRRHARHQAGFMASPDAATRSMNDRQNIYGYRKDGSEFPAQASLSRMRNGASDMVIVTLQDISRQKLIEERLTWQATHDPLTGLPNRAQLTERLEKALERAKRSGFAVGVIFVDLDNFKLVNDTYGHDTGDKLLMAIAERLMGLVRAGDTVARFGGDEFVIISEQVKDSVAIVNLAERINKAARDVLSIGGHRITATVSLGVTVGQGTDSAQDLLRKSDAAMYSAKDSGRDGWRFYSDDLQVKAKKQLEIVSGLRHAIERNEIRMVLQPIVDMQNSLIIGAEALMRWNHSGTAVPPSDFIPAAESSGLISNLGSWAIENTVALCAEWEKKNLLPDDFTFSINMSTRQLVNSALPVKIRQILRRHDVDPGRIQLEITETALMQDLAVTTDILLALEEIGLSIAVDDFGTGYSSLAQLVRMRVDCLKIDRMFVNDLSADSRNRSIAASIISMAHNLDLKVVAEGVETAEQARFLQEHKCDAAQGYHFFRPIEIPDCEKTWLPALKSKGPRLAQSA
jgi:diguanylate cyclase (GGDEF)-like protein/PAS domain S-box-containing protein